MILLLEEVSTRCLGGQTTCKYLCHQRAPRQHRVLFSDITWVTLCVLPHRTLFNTVTSTFEAGSIFNAFFTGRRMRPRRATPKPHSTLTVSVRVKQTQRLSMYCLILVGLLKRQSALWKLLSIFVLFYSRLLSRFDCIAFFYFYCYCTVIMSQVSNRVLMLMLPYW